MPAVWVIGELRVQLFDETKLTVLLDPDYNPDGGPHGGRPAQRPYHPGPLRYPRPELAVHADVAVAYARDREQRAIRVMEQERREELTGKSKRKRLICAS